MTSKAAERWRSEGAPPISPKASSAPQPNGYANGSEFEYRPPPPHNLEAERALLGAILIDNKVHSRVADFVYPVDFFDPLHQQIFETAARLIEAGQRADPITLKPFFEDAAPYLGTLVQLRGLALETSSTALLLAHPSLSGMASGSGTSGSTAWSNSVRSRLYLTSIASGTMALRSTLMPAFCGL
jgi:hypothetical protein